MRCSGCEVAVGGGASRKMHFPSCASGRIGRTGRKLKIMTEVTIAPTSGRTAPNPFVQDGPHPTLSFRVNIMTTPYFTKSKLALTTSQVLHPTP